MELVSPAGHSATARDRLRMRIRAALAATSHGRLGSRDGLPARERRERPPENAMRAARRRPGNSFSFLPVTRADRRALWSLFLFPRWPSRRSP